jgi:hypothetical protein
MTQHQKFLKRLMGGAADAGISFQAKPYQVKQVRNLIRKYRLE